MSSQEGKIIDYLGENKFVVLLPEEQEPDGNPGELNITIAHDYVRIEGPSHFQMERKGDSYPYKNKGGACNWVPSRASVTIPIRDMQKYLLPLLKDHPYLQPEHLKDRQYSEDDKYFKDYGLDKPRYRRGDSYPAYAHQSVIITHYDKVKGWTVMFRRFGSSIMEIVSMDLFNKIKGMLQLYLSEWELHKDEKKKSTGTT